MMRDLYEYPPAPSVDTIRRKRESVIDPVNWVDCEPCNGQGVVCEDPYGFGKEWVCSACEGEGGYEDDDVDGENDDVE